MILLLLRIRRYYFVGQHASNYFYTNIFDAIPRNFSNHRDWSTFWGDKHDNYDTHYCDIRSSARSH